MFGLNGALLLMGGLALNICVCGMLFRPPEFYFRRFLLKQDKQRVVTRDENKTKELAIDTVNKQQTEAVARSNQNGTAGGDGANPVAKTDLLQEIITVGDVTTRDVGDAEKNELPAPVTGGTSNGLIDKSESCFVNEAFSSSDESPVDKSTAATLIDVKLQTGHEGPVSFINVKYPSPNSTLAQGENKSETKSSCSSRLCLKSLRKWITCVDSKKTKHNARRGADLWRILTNPVVMLYATVTAVSNRLVHY